MSDRQAPADPLAGAPVEAPVIDADDPDSFAWRVLATRHPALIEQVRDAHPYGPAQRAALDALAAETAASARAAGAGIGPLPETAGDRDRWAAWGLARYAGRSWFEVPFLWAESYFYRRLLGAVDYFEPGGVWQGVDPFAPAKRAELTGEALAEQLRALGADDTLDAPEGRDAVLLAALWGNRADLGFLTQVRDSGGEAAASDLVADDRAALWALLDAAAGPPATVALVADNAGRELVPDLVLVDHLLRHTRAEAVVVHVKPYPYYVSDATAADLSDALRRLRAAEGPAGEAGARLWRAAAEGRLTVRTHPFWCAPLSFHHLPDDLRRELAACALTILKGDLNYRRLVGDRLWPPTTPFAALAGHFPTPVAALRTLKSDVVCGLTPERVAALDATGQPWRTTGRHALVQVAGPGAAGPGAAG